MVRRASRLPPNAQSVEEVVLARIAHGDKAAGASRRKPSAAATTTSSSSLAAPAAATAATASSSSSSSSSAATLECIESVATELARLDQRLVAVAHKRKGSARSALTEPPRAQHRDQIEQYIHASMGDVHASYAARTAASAAARTRAASQAAYDPAQGARVGHAVRGVRSTMRRLDKVFDEVATGDRQRHLAATKIATLVRGFLMRRRFRKMRYALGQWRARTCGSLLVYLEQFSAREAFLNAQVARLGAERTQALLRRVVVEMRDVVLLHLPLRHSRLEETECRFASKQHARAGGAFRAWKRCALGPRSRKRAAADARARHQAARSRLEALERFDVITSEMVHDEFLKENIRVVRARHPRCVLHTCFRVLLHGQYLPMRLKLVRAAAHDRQKRLARVWRAWLPAFRAAQADRAFAGAAASDRRTLERFDQHHNLRQIDAHYRATHARKHLRAWAIYGQRIRRVRRLFEDTTREHLTLLLRRWRVRAGYQHALRGHAVEAWRAFGRRIFQTPFRAWYSFAVARRADRAAKESLCVAYQRRARRHTKYAFFRLWKHQVLFGSVEGTHSKLHLLRSLEDQKRVCLALEHNARLYERNVQALEAAIAALEGQLTSKQLELVAQHEASQAARFSVHAAEQSIARVQGMLEAVRQIHAGTLARVERSFRENPLLTQDLHEVVALHVARRQEVLAKLSLDGDELEIQRATEDSEDGEEEAGGDGGGKEGKPRSRADQLLLHRVKWVLSRLDLADQARGHGVLGASPHAVDQLCALFEFIRSGETRALTTDNDPSHPRPRPNGHGGVGGGGGGGEVAGRADLADGNETWHAFLRALAARFAPARMLQLQERLVKRAAEMGDELRELKSRPQIFNAYSGSAHPRRETADTGDGDGDR